MMVKIPTLNEAMRKKRRSDENERSVEFTGTFDAHVVDMFLYIFERLPAKSYDAILLEMLDNIKNTFSGLESSGDDVLTLSINRIDACREVMSIYSTLHQINRLTDLCEKAKDMVRLQTL